MSYQATIWAASVRTGNATLKSLLMAIANYADEDGECFPKQSTLAYDTEMSKRSVQRGLEKLQDGGFIKLKEQFFESGGQTSNLIRLVGFSHHVKLTPPPKKEVTNCQSSHDSIVSCPPRQQESNQEESINSQYKSKSAARSPAGTRIPEDWQLTPDLGNYGRSKGLTRNEVLAEAEKFVNYWRSAAGAKARKVDWNLTWKGWILRTAERLGRRPPDLPPDPPPAAEMDRKSWEIASRLYANSSNWHRQWGPEPGHPRCLMPPDLQQQFVTGH